MNEWLARELGPVRAVSSGTTVVLDRDQLIDPAAQIGKVVMVSDWWALRSTYERYGRRRPSDLPALVLVVTGSLATQSLPWDIGLESAAVAVVKLPGSPGVRAAIVELEPEEAVEAIAAVTAAPGQPEGALLRAVTGVEVGGSTLRRGDQLRLAARLAVRMRPSAALASVSRHWVKDRVAASLLDDPPECGPLQRVWHDFAVGRDDDWAGDLAVAKAELSMLFAAGLLEPVAASRSLEGWAAVGIRRPSSEERARELFEAAPTQTPTDLTGWHSVAEWWGDVRRLVAAGPIDLKEAAWKTWSELDIAFLAWLREHYGVLLTSAAKRPVAVHRVAHFLARRVRDGDADRVILVVLDGLGHAQWAHLRERTGIDVIDAGSVVALVPTYTTVSRQAIFAGDLPTSSPNTLWTTQPEPRRWRDLWVADGFAATGVTYHRVKGRLPHDHLAFGEARVIGVVVNAVDDLMHSSELFGDAQLLANLDVWADNGFLLDLVARANAQGIETWITADHGNLECVGSGAISEGVAIEANGKRLLRYPNRTLRDTSTAEGIVWDDIPGMPATAEPLLFAAGRNAFTNNRISISHGSLSLDEVIVPLARVRA